MRTTTWAVALAGLFVSAAMAAEIKSYQVTGPIVDITADSITVQKGKENWQIGKGPSVKAPATLKKGDKVTVYYQMNATEIEAKGGAPAKK